MSDPAAPPTASHFHDSYKGQPPWDIGHPQPALVALAARARARGSVLDVGCGTGEHALFYAARGHEAWGVDAVPAAIEKAHAKAAERGLSATFVVGDALELGRLGRRFDQVIDSGLFHVFSDAERPRYVESLASVLGPGGMLHLLCFSELTPGDFGPRRVTQAELRAAFGRGWTVHEIASAAFDTITPDRPQAWRAIIERTS